MIRRLDLAWLRRKNPVKLVAVTRLLHLVRTLVTEPQPSPYLIEDALHLSDYV